LARFTLLEIQRSNQSLVAKMYEKTLALKTDPFDPKLPDPAPKDLVGNPLLLDCYPELEKLFCWELGDLLDFDTGAGEMLFGITPAKPSVVANEGILIIRGGRATGKTTFASHLKRRILDAQGPEGKPLQLFTFEKSASNSGDFQQQMSAFESEIKGKLGPSRVNLFVYIENVPPLGFESVNALFEALNGHFRVYLLTTTDNDLTQYQLDWYYGAKIKLMETRNMSLKDVERYISHRVKQFRSFDRKEIEQASDVFPFGPTAPSRILGQKDEPIRVVNRWLSRAIVSHHKRLLETEPDLDVAVAPASKLASLLIS
jgi:hypothetical protein